MNELRILSGGKKGTAIALYKGSFKIGPSYESTLMLGADEIGNSSLTIKVSHNGKCALSAILGNVHGPDGTLLNIDDNICIDSPICVGSVWFAVSEAFAPWFEPSTPSRRSTVDTSQPEVIITSDTSTATLQGVKKKRKRAIGRVGVNSLMVVLLAVGIGNYVNSRTHTRISLDDIGEDNHGDATVQRQENKRLEQQQHNLLLVNSMLSEREINNVSLVVENGSVTISGFVNGREREVLDRLLSRIDKNNPSIQVSDETKSMETSLPFEVISISFGNNSRIIVEDHGVMVVGDVIEGYTLESIAANKVRFVGDQSLEISW